MNEHDLFLAMRTRVLCLDGAMGTELQHTGLAPGACGELLNAESPDVVRAIHRRYREAGADVLLTNTFGGSRLRLAQRGLATRAIELNRKAAELARDAAGERGFVLGDIGPFGGLLAPLGGTAPEAVRGAFEEQVGALLDGGADGILIETMTSLEEMSLAVAAARDAGARIVMASFAFDHKHNALLRTMLGVGPGDACEAMCDAGVDAVGANCGADLEPEDLVAIVETYREHTDLPVLIEPNAGRPELTPDGVVYHERPEDFGARASAWIAAGAGLVGGCCGTTPEHIRAIARACRGGS